MERKYRGTDDSLTARHVKCLSKLFYFFGQELLCPQMTNVKALALGSSGIIFCSIIPSLGNDSGIASCVINSTFVCIRTISWLTVFLESFKMISRIRFHYSVYFSDKCYHCPNYFYAFTGNKGSDHLARKDNDCDDGDSELL